MREIGLGAILLLLLTLLPERERKSESLFLCVCTRAAPFVYYFSLSLSRCCCCWLQATETLHTYTYIHKTHTPLVHSIDIYTCVVDYKGKLYENVYCSELPPAAAAGFLLISICFACPSSGDIVCFSRSSFLVNYTTLLPIGKSNCKLIAS